jgi:Cys-rich repeat protein
MNRNRSLVLWVAMGCPVVLLWGCNFLLSPCANVSCDEGEVCRGGQCVPEPECDSNDDCGAGEVCDNGDCVAEVECDSDADCDAGEVCDEATNTCVECDGDADCSDGNACTADSCVGQTCVNTPIACVTTATCPAACDTACVNGFCSD